MQIQGFGGFPPITAPKVLIPATPLVQAGFGAFSVAGPVPQPAMLAQYLAAEGYGSFQPFNAALGWGHKVPVPTSSDVTKFLRGDGTWAAPTFSLEGGVAVNDLGAAVDFRVEGDTDANALVVKGSNDNVGVGTNAPDASAKFHVVSTTKAALPAPVMTAAQIAAIGSPIEGLMAYESDSDMQRQWDGQRWRGVGAMGWCPYAYPINFVASSAFTTALSLPANGGSIAIPIWVPSHMFVSSCSIRNTDTASARTWNWDLYTQYLNNGNAPENSLVRIIQGGPGAANDSFTPGAASTRTLSASTVTAIPPGVYWLVVQNRHATNTFGLGSTAASAAFAVNSAQTKTTSNANGDPLDFIAATWTKVTAIYAVRLNARVFGSNTEF